MALSTGPTYHEERYIRPKQRVLAERAVDWNEDSVAREFADDFGEDFEDVEVTDWDEFGVPYWQVEVNRREYMAFEDEDDAEQFAIGRVTQDLEDEPEIFNQGWLSSHVFITDTDRRLIGLEEAEAEAEGMDDYEFAGYIDKEDEYTEAEENDDTDAMAKIVEEGREKFVDDRADEIQRDLRSPIDYFVDDRGIFTMEELMKQPWVNINVDDAASEAVRIDGVAHFLAGYDGAENTTDQGLVYYRQN
jgi:hypothetical protein